MGFPKAKGAGPFKEMPVLCNATQLGYEALRHWSIFSEGKADRFIETKLVHHITL